MSKGNWAHQAIEYLHETRAAFEQCEQSIRVNLTKTAPKQLELRYAATLVFPRRIRAVLLLCEEHLAHEADAIVRGLLELGFTLHWADSEDKARRVANKAATASETLMIGAKKAGYEVSQEDVADASARVDGGLTGLPNMRQLAESSDLQGVYLVSYRRLCSSSHADWTHFEQIMNAPHAIENTLCDLLFASLLALGVLADEVLSQQAFVDRLQVFLGREAKIARTPALGACEIS